MTVAIRARLQPVGPYWQEAAVCRNDDPELWFADGTGASPGYDQLTYAMNICATCPVRRQCLEAALEDEGGKAIQLRNGIRGGLTPKERHNIYRRSARQAQAQAA